MANADQLAAEMHAFYPRYIDSFNGDDQVAYVANFSFPCVLLGGNQAVSVVNDAATWITMMANAKAAMRAKGWARTGIEKTYAWPTAPDMGLLMSDFLRHRSDGSVLLRGRACYTLRRDGDRLRIIAMMGVAPPMLGPGDIPRPK
jgi:hypothetical protein